MRLEVLEAFMACCVCGGMCLSCNLSVHVDVSVVVLCVLFLLLCACAVHVDHSQSYPLTITPDSIVMGKQTFQLLPLLLLLVLPFICRQISLR
jgi:hypothetical protein